MRLKRVKVPLRFWSKTHRKQNEKGFLLDGTKSGSHFRMFSKAVRGSFWHTIQNWIVFRRFNRKWTNNQGFFHPCIHLSCNVPFGNFSLFWAGKVRREGRRAKDGIPFVLLVGERADRGSRLIPLTSQRLRTKLHKAARDTTWARRGPRWRRQSGKDQNGPNRPEHLLRATKNGSLLQKVATVF